MSRGEPDCRPEHAQSMLLWCQGAARLDRTEIGHSGEGRLLVGHGPREGGVAVDSSFVGQLAGSVGRFEGSGCDDRYTTFLAADDTGAARQGYCYKFKRVAVFIHTYDPDNLFHLNHNIQPTAS